MALKIEKSEPTKLRNSWSEAYENLMKNLGSCKNVKNWETWPPKLLQWKLWCFLFGGSTEGFCEAMGGRVLSSKDWTLPWPCPGNRGDGLLSWFSHRQLLLFSGEADFGGDQTSSKCMVESFSPMIMNCLAWCHIVTPICFVSWGNLNSWVICMMNLRRFLLPDLLTVI